MWLLENLQSKRALRKRVPELHSMEKAAQESVRSDLLAIWAIRILGQCTETECREKRSGELPEKPPDIPSSGMWKNRCISSSRIQQLTRLRHLWNPNNSRKPH